MAWVSAQVRLSDEDVERERSIVVEEWRQGRGCMQRATEDFFKLVVKGRCDTIHVFSVLVPIVARLIEIIE